MRIMRLWLAVGLWLSLSLGTAHALPAISLSEPLPEVGADDCPLLTQIKYPWLECRANAWGGRTIRTATVEANASFEADRRIPVGHDFVEGEGAWLGGER